MKRGRGSGKRCMTYLSEEEFKRLSVYCVSNKLKLYAGMKKAILKGLDEFDREAEELGRSVERSGGELESGRGGVEERDWRRIFQSPTAGQRIERTHSRGKL